MTMTAPAARAAARWTLRALSVALFGLVLAALAVLIVIPKVTHGSALTVLTGSMSPRLPVGSVVVERPVDPQTLKIGDIATYHQRDGDYVTHRIVAIDRSAGPISFTFQGDANRSPDPTPVPATAIHGKVWFHVPYLGSVQDALHSHGVGLITLIAGLGVFSVFEIGSGLRDQRRAKRQATPLAAPLPAAPASEADGAALNLQEAGRG